MLLGAAIIILLYVLGVPGFGNETIATVKGKSIKKNDIYNEIKKANSVNYALDVVDSAILKTNINLQVTKKKKYKIKLIITLQHIKHITVIQKKNS